MTIDIRKTADSTVAVLCGSFDTLAAESIAGEFESLKDSLDGNVVLDCTAVDYISSSGLRLLLSLRKAAKAKNKVITLLNVHPNIMEVLTVTHFDRMFNIK